MFNKLFGLRYLQSDWSEGYFVPLHIKGEIYCVNNYYRRITLLNTFGKLFTKILNKRLNIWVEKYVHIEAQAGVR